jgi:hypothetical protein
MPDDGRAGPTVGGGQGGPGPDSGPLPTHLAAEDGQRSAGRHYTPSTLQSPGRDKVGIQY